MGVVKVEPAGLELLAARCQELAVELTTLTASEVVGGSFQHSAVAVNAVNAGITTAAQALANRMTATAEKLSISAAEYVAQDQTNAAAIETVKL